MALLASPAAAGGGGAKAACDMSSHTTCTWNDQWSEWGEKFNATIFQNATSYYLAQTLYLNPAKVEHWQDEWHMEMGCCEHWRCNQATSRCVPPISSGAAALAPALAAALLLVAGMLA